MTEDKFNSLTLGVVKQKDMIDHIKSYLEEDPEAEYSIVIGSDSQERGITTKSGKTINLITAVVIYKKGFGGRYFWKSKKVININSLRQKVYTETLESLAFAMDFVPKLQKALNGKTPNFNLEIHVDVGEKGQTREMIKELVGMVTGNGFVAKTKPFSFGASNIADKYT